MDHYILILAAGQGARLHSKTPKQFLEINGLPMVMHSVIKFNQANPNSKIYIGLSEDFFLKWSTICQQYNFSIEHEVYVGGATRLDTVFAGLEKINQSNVISKKDLIIVHDAARPFVTPEFISHMTTEAIKKGNAVPFIKLKDSLRQTGIELNSRSRTVSREDYFIIQTPQVFRFKKLLKSYITLQSSNKKNKNTIDYSILCDDSSVYDVCGKNSINFIPGLDFNIKITTEIDYFIAEKIIEFSQRLK